MKKIIFCLLFCISQPVFADNFTDSDALFDWAETQYPELFSPANQLSQEYEEWYYRYYPLTGNYAGVNSSGEVWVLGDVFDGMLYVDTLESLLALVTPETIVSANWRGTAISDVYLGCIVQINTTLSQNGTELTGLGSLSGNCIAEDSFVINGTVNGSIISYGVAVNNNTVISFTGTISNDGQTLTGSYSWPDDNDQGTWSLSLQ